MADLTDELKRHIDFIQIRATFDDELEITHHPKERSLAVHIPREYEGSDQDVLKEIVITLLAIDDIGHFPKQISASRRQQYLRMWDEQKDAGRS